MNLTVYPMDATTNNSSRSSGEVSYRIRGRILHTTVRGPFKSIVSAIPRTIEEFLQRLSQQGKWGQIIVFQQSILMPDAAMQEFADYLKLRYSKPETRPVVALVLEPDVEGAEPMRPQLVAGYQNAGIDVQDFVDYTSALNWIESKISQFSTRVEWNDSYKIGDPEIDEQHRELFKRAAYVIGAISHEGQVIAAMRLFQYLRTHFSHEEELMRHSAYPDITTHMAAHQELIDQLHQISLKIAKEHLIKSDLEAFISDYFLTHMDKMDRAVIAHVHSHQQ